MGAQSFADLREAGYFYIDKTDFIQRWWESGDVVTLICRPRRFGKTLNLRTVESFLSPPYVAPTSKSRNAHIAPPLWSAASQLTEYTSMALHSKGRPY